MTSSPILTLPPTFTRPSHKYFFGLSIFDGNGRLSSSNVTVLVSGKSNKVPIVSLSVKGGNIVNGGTIFVLNAAVNYSSSPLWLEWSFPFLQRTLSSANTSSTLSVVQFPCRVDTTALSLVYGTYTFTLRATPIGCIACSVMSEISVTVNRAPVSGALSVNPSIGIGIGSNSSTSFTLIAYDWYDVNMPLQYTFEVLDPGNGKVALASKSERSYLVSALPSGTSASYVVTLSVTVYDSLGAQSTESTTTQVLPPPAERLSSLGQAVSSFILDSRASGSVDLFPVYVTSYLSALSNMSQFNIGNNSVDYETSGNITIALLRLYESYLEVMDFSDASTLTSAVSICNVAAGNDQLILGNTAVAQTLTKYVGLLAELYSQYNGVGIMDELLGCLDSISEALIQPTITTTATGARRLEATNSTRFSAQTNAQLKSLFEGFASVINIAQAGMILNENYVYSGSVFQAKIEVGLIPALSTYFQTVPVFNPQSELTELTFNYSTVNFSSISTNQALLSSTQSFRLQALSATFLVNPQCASFATYCDVFGSPPFAQFLLTLESSLAIPLEQYMGLPLSITTGTSEDVTGQVNIQNTQATFACNKNYTCTGSNYGSGKVNCPSSGSYLFYCPLYNDRAAVYDQHGRRQENCTCTVQADGSTTTCSCPARSSVTRTDGLYEYTFVIGAGIVLTSVLESTGGLKVFTSSPPSTYPTVSPTASAVVSKNSIGEAFAKSQSLSYAITVPPAIVCCFFMLISFLVIKNRRKLRGAYKSGEDDTEGPVEVTRQQLLDLIRLGLKSKKKGSMDRAEEIFFEAADVIERAVELGKVPLHTMEIVEVFVEYANILNDQGKDLEAMAYFEKAHSILQDYATAPDYVRKDMEALPTDKFVMKALHKNMTKEEPEATDEKSPETPLWIGFYKPFMKPNPLASMGTSGESRTPREATTESREESSPQASEDEAGSETSSQLDLSNDDYLMGLISDSDSDRDKAKRTEGGYDEVKEAKDEDEGEVDEDDDDSDGSVDTATLKERIVAKRRRRLELEQMQERKIVKSADIPAALRVDPPPEQMSTFVDDFIRSHTTVL